TSCPNRSLLALPRITGVSRDAPTDTLALATEVRMPTGEQVLKALQTLHPTFLRDVIASLCERSKEPSRRGTRANPYGPCFFMAVRSRSLWPPTIRYSQTCPFARPSDR